MTILKANKIESGHDMRMNVGHIWESRNAYHVTKHTVDILLLCWFLFSTIQFFFPSDGITLSVYNNISCVCVFRWRASHFEIQYNDIRRDPNGISVNEITQFMSICNIYFFAFRVNFISKPYALQHNKIKPIKHPYPPPEWTGDIALQLIDIKVYALRIEWVSSLHTHAQFSLWLHALCALIALTAVRMMPFFGSIISFTPFVAVVFCF